ncbi:aminoacyl-tRNA deacylase [Propionigenium maris DSM 9537]|uniref:Aminoacyl-tRNA deacylase n=1 Tax=Propionigenium maris DSM 9537 TaxID=1123000 RepID=A0A9W6GHR4_9FUSO|nr:prolyl-tRNA synthetase associated domain-containing protein [Propionigenium maris]GLI55434.1 aminoacyl-tRNA deacylase [Propionigenium maris DSM 9537]
MKEKKVYDYLKKAGVEIYSRYEHRAVYTMEEANELDIDLDGSDCKTLFLKSKKGRRYFLVSLVAHKKADLKSIGEQLGVKRITFGSEAELEECLGLTRGAVSPMGLINDLAGTVEFCMDRSFMGSHRICIHPNTNTVTMTLEMEGFMRYIESLGREVRWIEV